MTFRTLLSLVRDGRLLVLLAMTRAVRPHHRLAFLAAGASSGLFAKLASGPLPVDRIADELRADPSMRDGLEAWLGLGVTLGVLRRGPRGFSLRGMLAKSLTRPESDAAAAFVVLASRRTVHLRGRR
jgi:hypothetical protein